MVSRAIRPRDFPCGGDVKGFFEAMIFLFADAGRWFPVSNSGRYACNRLHARKLLHAGSYRVQRSRRISEKPSSDAENASRLPIEGHGTRVGMPVAAYASNINARA